MKKYTQKKIKLIKPNKKGEFMKINSRDEAIGLFLNNAGLYENCDFSNLDLSYIDNDIFDENEIYIVDDGETISEWTNVHISLTKTHFVNCNFRNTNLSGIEPYKSYFTNCDFRGALIIENSYFTYVTFKNCDFRGAVLTGAYLTNTIYDPKVSGFIIN